MIAHELWHVRCRDVLTQTFAVLLAATLVELSRLGGWLSRWLLYVFGPIAAAFVHLLLSPRRELDADSGGRVDRRLGERRRRAAAPRPRLGSRAVRGEARPQSRSTR